MGERHLGRKRHLAVITAALLISLFSPLTAGTIYRWVDDQGNVHFGDNPPDKNRASDLSADYDFSLPFRVLIEGIQYEVPVSLQQRLEVHVSKIFSIYRHALAIEYSPSQDFQIHLYGDPFAYQAHQREVAPVLENAAGFYNPETNRVSARVTSDLADLLRLVTHECSHAVTMQNGGNVPIWLNEGLAEYFAALNVYGLTAEVSVTGRWLYMTRNLSMSLDDFRTLLDASYQSWYRNDGGVGRSYGPSWAITFFLMESATGRALIKDILAMQTSGSPVASSSIIEQRWPQGMAGLHYSWQRWLEGTIAPHRY